MEVKKNEKLRLEKNSGLYFAIGLTLVLALAYLGLEWKTYYPDIPNDGIICELVVMDENWENPPNIKPPEPPKPKIIPLTFKAEPDDSTIDETLFDMPEPDQHIEIPDTIEIPDFIEPPIDEIIPITAVEEKPIFPGCENASDKYACFQEMIQKHIRKNFNYPKAAIDMNLQGRVAVMFTIQKDGSIGNVQLRGPHELLEKEATRIISKLPKMQPGKQRGTPVKVPFSIPITFKLQ